PAMSGVFLLDADKDPAGMSGTYTELVLPYLDSQVESTLTTGKHAISRRIDIDDDTHVIVLLTPVTSVTQTSSSSDAESTKTQPAGADPNLEPADLLTTPPATPSTP